MKKYNFIKASLILVIALAFNSSINAQIKANQTVANSAINSSTAFLDAASATVWNASSTLAKGILFPRANLTLLVLTNNGSYLAANNPNRFDGLILYNTGTGNTPPVGSGIGNQSVAPGFYYFSNPGTPSSISSGQWVPLPSSSKFNIGSGESATNTKLDGAQVYALKGQFTTTGSSTAVTITAPGATSLYGITIFKTAGTGSKVVYSRDLYSYDVTTGAAVTGSPGMSVVYPADTYDYVIEYLK